MTMSNHEFKTEEDLAAENAQRELFLKRKKKGFGTLLFDSSRDCPICLDEFKEKDEVI